MSDERNVIKIWECKARHLIDGLATAVGELVDEHEPLFGMVLVFDRKGDTHTIVVGEVPEDFEDDPEGALSELFATMSEQLDPFEDDVRARN